MNIVGHEMVREKLKKQIASDMLGHAYLFSRKRWYW